MNILLFLITLLLSFMASGQVVKGGIDPPRKDPDVVTPSPVKIPGGGPTISKVNELEKKIRTFRDSIQRRQKKCRGSVTEFKKFSEIISYLNLQSNSGHSSHQIIDHCDELRFYRCLMNKKNIKYLKKISQDPVLEHYLIEHEDLFERDVQELRKNLERHIGQ